MKQEVLVMRGSLAEFELPDVLQVVGLSRQHTVIELCGADGKRRGLITLKSGQVLSAELGGTRGKSAFFGLFGQRRDAFHVFRLPELTSYGQPLGPLADLLCEVGQGDDEDDVPVTQVDPAPPPHTPRPRAAGSTVSPMPTVASVQAVTTPRPLPPPLAQPQPAARTAPPRPRAQGTGPQVAKRRPDKPAARRVPAPHADKLVVAIASPKGGVGKTTISLNLALSLAERGLDTIIVDADINGDILSLLDARDRVDRGAFDLLDDPSGASSVIDALRETAQPGLRILPACGPSLGLQGVDDADRPEAWARLLGAVRGEGDITLVDCPAGMFHTTASVLRSATHVVGVFQAEIVSSRSFSMFLRALSSLPEGERPALAGVVVNMFQGRADGSIEAFHSICSDADRHRLFDTTIPRSDVFSRASEIGQPLRIAGEDASPIAFLFDMLAEEVCGRIGVTREERRATTGFLV